MAGYLRSTGWMEIGPVVLIRGENDGNKPAVTATPVE